MAAPLRTLQDLPEPHLPLSNARLEQFAQAKASGKSHREAAQLCGFSTAIAACASTINRPGVRERIAYLSRERLAMVEGQREQIIEVVKSGFGAASVTLDVIAGELFINVQAARAAGDFKESTAALKALAELVGLASRVKEPNKAGSNGPLPLTGGTLNVQINNRVPERSGTPVGAIVEAWSADAVEGAAVPVSALSDERADEVVGSDDGRAWDDYGDLPVVPEGDGAKQPLGVRRVHDA